MQIGTGEFRTLTAAAAEAGYDSGRDAFAYELGTGVCAMIRDGATDTEIVEFTQEMVSARSPARRVVHILK